MKYRFMGFDESTLKRFWSKVDIRGRDECWEWLGGKSGGRYGQFRSNGLQINTHRFVLMHATNTFDTPMHALHSCDNTACCNPAHLRWGSQKENMRDLVCRNASWTSHIKDAAKKRRKLTPFKIFESACMLINGHTLNDAAAAHGVSIMAIYNKTRKRWGSKLP